MILTRLFQRTNMLEFCKGLTVPICLLTPFGHIYYSSLENMLIESVIFDADIFRTTAIEMQVLQQRAETKCFTAYDIERSGEVDGLQPITIFKCLFLDAHKGRGEVNLLKMMAAIESLRPDDR